MSQEVQGQIRTILAFIGGVAVSRGWIDSETMLGIVGGVTAIVAAVWSWRSKKS